MIVSITLALTLLTAAVYLTLAVSAWRAGTQPNTGSRRLDHLGLWLAWALHAVGLALQVHVANSWHFGFAQALSATAWLVLGVYCVERQVFPKISSRWVLLVLAATVVLAPSLWPGKPAATPPAGWLALHWVLGLAAYGMLGAALVHAWLLHQAEGRIRKAAGGHAELPLMGIERLMFRFIAVGFGLLTATLCAGWWLQRAQGSAMRLDHKTVFAMLAWITFAALLALRQWQGLRGQKATRMVYAGCALLLLSYVGSRFVLEVILQR